MQILNFTEISEIIKKRISNLNIENEEYDKGIIISVYDGIIRIHGLYNVMYGEILEINNYYSIVLSLEFDSVYAVVIGNYKNLKEGMKVKSTGKLLEVPVGNNLLGRVLNGFGEAIDGKGNIVSDIYLPVERQAPGIFDRYKINESLHTGYKSIDAMIPIGKGQRELIIGDRQTGKTSLAIDIIINQKSLNVKCIYVAIGQKISSVINIVDYLKKYDALNNTIIISATAAESAILQYLAPYTGCTIGEYFRDCGEDALIVYDDLSKQAIAYRQISLLLRRPPGREAFPGDIFYLHARLLERSAKVNSSYVENFTKGKIKNKTGSLTALPIIETQSGDISSFIPTNVISITDGQIYLETDLFNSGIRPAINPGLSVSRVGSSAQTDIIKKLSFGIRASLAQYRELYSFSQFSSDLDSSTREILSNGEKIIELMKQKQYNLMSVAHQSIILSLINYNFINDIPLNKIDLFSQKLLKHFEKYHYKLLKKINVCVKFDLKIKNEIINVITLFKNTEYE
ncbi:F0F1 ATP synthase subunit alpha [Candidatus Purcelliella pentastirinorum]|uniref:ATP synthase subunit alpha n=1 Tax=Candidatus Purcelliella pentastirinorum TaxID=472834 RepID=A0AAX3N7I9_9ENTR|nr:F0F1 ATP synthase subunit alpha [Candidatus Purcelliella pentastirinorum]WDI78504.1 F0F1 ATP synthase subunit alpha [Candidatus Purcelliella pentastirinorum]WDR80467.1 F0F1 ATP synthase subunit alpha [Candidatus Purcelliella pentastirinorum]